MEEPKIKPDRLKLVVDKIIQLRADRGDWKYGTVGGYRLAFKHFIVWYDGCFDRFDSTPAIIREWICRAKARNDNLNNYRVIGNLVQTIVDTLGATDEIDETR